MKKILTLVFVSALGGLLTLGGYKFFIENETQPLAVEQSSDLPVFVPTNNTITSSTATAPDFVKAAEKSLDAVVHVKNTAIINAPISMRDLFYGTEIRTKHTEQFISQFERLLKLAEECDPDQLILDSVKSNVNGRMYRMIVSHTEGKELNELWQ